MWRFRKPTFSPIAPSIRSSVGFNRIFNHIKSFGDSTCEAANLGIQGADLDSNCSGVTAPASLIAVNQGLHELWPEFDPDVGGYWSLGDRGFAPFQGGTNVYSVSDTLRHDSRQA